MRGPDVSDVEVERAESLDEQNNLLEYALGLDVMPVCAHDDADNCACTKPRPGLLLKGANRFGVDLRSSVTVGDRWRDVEAGQNAGCHTVYIEQLWIKIFADGADLESIITLSRNPLVQGFTTNPR